MLEHQKLPCKTKFPLFFIISLCFWNQNCSAYYRNLGVSVDYIVYQVQKNNEKHIAKNKRYIFTDLAKD